MDDEFVLHGLSKLLDENLPPRQQSMIQSLLLLTAFVLPADTLALSASASSIQYGDSVEIRWALEPAQDGYVSHVGRVTGPGRRWVALEQTTTYTLLVEDGRTVSTTVLVYGSRASDPYPDPEQFSFPIRGTRRATPHLAFVDRARAYLQDSLGLTVREGSTLRGRYQFVSHLSEKFTTGEPLPRRVRARQTAFLVDIEPPVRPGGEIQFTVSSYVQYQRGAEGTWRRETETEVYVAAGQAVRRALER